MTNIPGVYARGDVIEEKRDALYIPRDEFAGMVGISYNHLHGIETGKNKVSLRVLRRIATELSVRVDTLIDQDRTRRERQDENTHPSPNRPTQAPRPRQPPSGRPQSDPRSPQSALGAVAS